MSRAKTKGALIIILIFCSVFLILDPTTKSNRTLSQLPHPKPYLELLGGDRCLSCHFHHGVPPGMQKSFVFGGDMFEHRNVICNE